MRRGLIQIVLAIVAVSIGFAFAGGDPEKDPQMRQLLQDAVQLIKNKNPAEAIPKCETVINSYKGYYDPTKQRVYCARSPVASLGSLLEAAADGKKAIVISSTWAEAFFLEAFALQELHRPNEAKAALLAALVLSPFDSQYLNELAEIFAREKNWAKAAELFQKAEDDANYKPDLNRAEELARAKRGQGYILIEMGKLDEAESKYQDCLATNPNDQKARAELAFVRQLASAAHTAANKKETLRRSKALDGKYLLFWYPV